MKYLIPTSVDSWKTFVNITIARVMLLSVSMGKIIVSALITTLLYLSLIFLIGNLIIFGLIVLPIFVILAKMRLLLRKKADTLRMYLVQYVIYVNISANQRDK